MWNDSAPADWFWKFLNDPDVSDDDFVKISPEPCTQSQITALRFIRPAVIRRLINDPLECDRSAILEFSALAETAPIWAELLNQWKNFKKLPYQRPQ